MFLRKLDLAGATLWTQPHQSLSELTEKVSEGSSSNVLCEKNMGTPVPKEPEYVI